METFPVLKIDPKDIVDTNGAGDAFVGGEVNVRLNITGFPRLFPFVFLEFLQQCFRLWCRFPVRAGPRETTGSVREGRALRCQRYHQTSGLHLPRKTWLQVTHFQTSFPSAWSLMPNLPFITLTHKLKHFFFFFKQRLPSSITFFYHYDFDQLPVHGFQSIHKLFLNQLSVGCPLTCVPVYVSSTWCHQRIMDSSSWSDCEILYSLWIVSKCILALTLPASAALKPIKLMRIFKFTRFTSLFFIFFFSSSWTQNQITWGWFHNVRTHNSQRNEELNTSVKGAFWILRLKCSVVICF